jgi:hypothetical protein
MYVGLYSRILNPPGIFSSQIGSSTCLYLVVVQHTLKYGGVVEIRIGKVSVYLFGKVGIGSESIMVR